MPAINLHLINLNGRHLLVPKELIKKVKKADTIPTRGVPVQIEIKEKSFSAERIDMAEGTLFSVDQTVATQMIDALGLDLGDDGIAAQAISGA